MTSYFLIPALLAAPPSLTVMTTTPLETLLGSFKMDDCWSLETLLRSIDPIPNDGRVILPFLTNWLMTRTTSLLGIEKPIPSTLLPLVSDASFIELIPITWPAILISGPPELPELIAASVWITLVAAAPDLAVMVRFLAEMIPLVTVLAYSLPIGDPIANTSCPAAISLEFPNDATEETLVELIFRTAKSVVLSVPTMEAETSFPLLKITFKAFDPDTTWLFVTIYAEPPLFL